MRELADRAEALANPPGTGWRDLFISRFVGALPASITDVSRVLVLAPNSIAPEPHGLHSVDGFFEHSAEGTFASTGRVAGTLDLTTREFSLHKQGAGERWSFVGALSSNGRVMHLRVTYEGYTTELFSLVHEDTFTRLVPA